MLTEKDLGELRELRARKPEAIREAALKRRRREVIRATGKIMILAVDHPARGALRVGARDMAMADRTDLLNRLVMALSRPGVDGVLGTPDILEDLLLLGALEEKLAIGSMNRGGLQGAAFELDDRFTAYNAQAIAEARLDGGKMLLRVDLDDPGTATTLESCGRAVTDLARNGLMAMVEPFVSRRTDGKVHNILTPEAVIKSIAIAQGLGATSAYTWLKLPVVDDMESVVAATTLPVVLLGGEPGDDADESYRRWQKTLDLPGVRGLVVGRSLIWPNDEDVVGAVDTAARMVHPELCEEVVQG